MGEKQAQKLSIRRETLRRLTDDAMAQVAGGTLVELAKPKYGEENGTMTTRRVGGADRYC